MSTPMHLNAVLLNKSVPRDTAAPVVYLENSVLQAVDPPRLVLLCSTPPFQMDIVVIAQLLNAWLDLGDVSPQRQIPVSKMDKASPAELNVVMVRNTVMFQVMAPHEVAKLDVHA